MFDIVDALTEFGADWDDMELGKADFEGIQIFGSRSHIHLVRDDARGLCHQSRVIESQFLAEILIVINGVPLLAPRHIQDIEKRFTANDMPQEFVAKTTVFMGALDQARDVGHGGAVVFRQINHSHKRMQCRKGISRCFWLRGGNRP